MALAPGTRLGPYEILEPIGAGGMGEVYRARDTKLDRDVAIKVLPEEFAADPERLVRFEREAKLLASLNHSNIASIHGFEESDGVKAIVLELVEGPTLAERIEQGPIPVDEAIAIAKQIAEALEAGHEAGVIHRDLKPANVKVKEDGTVKVLDYGLAKALEGETPGGADSQLSQSPTLTRQTQVGVILGTAAYMSPEQAKGKRVDWRTDIWAFGAVLYEMLGGRRAFGGEDVSDTLAAVLRAEPDWSALPSGTPETVLQVLRVCLAKDRKQRLQAVGDARLAMEGEFAVLSPVGPRSLSLAAVAAALAITSLITGLLVSRSGRPDRRPSSVVRFSLPLPESSGPAQMEMAISPSDDYLALRRGNDIYLRPIGEMEATRLTSEGPASSPFFSVDGQWLGFFSGGQLKKVAVSGGAAPIVLCDVAGLHSGASWGDDDTIVFAQSPGGIYRVAGSGGEPEVLVALNELEHGQFPQVLPGGDAVLFTLRVSNSAPWEEAQIVVHSLRTGERTVLIEGGRAALYAPTGHLIYSDQGTLFAVPFDIARLELGGGLVPLVETILPTWLLSRERHFNLSQNGALIYLVYDAKLNTTPLWLSRDGQERELDIPPRPYTWLHISPDGTRVALGVLEAPGNTDIWVHDLTHTVTSRFTFDAAADHDSIWTPDGTHIIFWSSRDGGGLFWKRSDGTGSVERLTSGTLGRAYAYGATPDGKRLVFNTGDAENEFDIKTVTLDDEHVVEPLLETRLDERRASVSPNGRWMAHMSGEAGERNVLVRPFPDVDEGRWQVSPDGGVSPRWSRDGSELFYWKEQTLMRVAVDPDLGPTFSFSAPEVMFEGPYRTGAADYDQAPDGKGFLVIRQQATDRPEVHVVLNWFSELERLVPTQ